MLNTFVIRHDAGHIQPLDDLGLKSTKRVTSLFTISETLPAAMSLDEIHEIIREVTPLFRKELQRLDDALEALTRQREDMLRFAFDEGITISVDDLESYID